jgi:hypothetical protein
MAVSYYYLDDKVKEDEDVARKWDNGNLASLKETDHSEELGVDGRIQLT